MSGCDNPLSLSLWLLLGGRWISTETGWQLEGTVNTACSSTPWWTNILQWKQFHVAPSILSQRRKAARWALCKQHVADLSACALSCWHVAIPRLNLNTLDIFFIYSVLLRTSPLHAGPYLAIVVWVANFVNDWITFYRNCRPGSAEKIGGNQAHVERPGTFARRSVRHGLAETRPCGAVLAGIA